MRSTGSRNILAARNRAVLASFASANVLLGFDYDGTLAPVVADPRRARMRRRTRRLLGAAARRYPCIVISGRAAGDLSQRIGRLPLAYVFANHGWERETLTDDTREMVGQWAQQLRSRLCAHPSLVVEDKGYSVAVHYRRARNKMAARGAIADAVRGLEGARVIGGDQAINLLVRDGPNKGVALQRARKFFACDVAIYVGNDDTDEDAFASAPHEQLLGIRVGMARTSRARFHLRSQVEIDRLLELLLVSRRSSTSSVADP